MQLEIEIEPLKKPTMQQRRHFNSFKEIAFSHDIDFRDFLYINFQIYSILDPSLSREEVVQATEMISKIKAV